MQRSILALILLSTFALGQVWAQGTPAEKPKGPWSGSLGIGFLNVTGNAESRSSNAEGRLNFDQDKWHHELFGRALGQSQNNVSTAEAYKLAYTLNYDITDRTYGFGLLDWNKDLFGAFSEQAFQVAGIGRRFIVSDKHLLNGEIGIGATQNEAQDGTTDEEFVTRLSGDYTWNISENAVFSQTLAVNISSANTFLESVTALRTSIAGPLGLSLSYTVRNNSDVLPGTEKTDTWTAINLDYGFGM
jgi:putative salt-induced outer membrane protein